MDVLGSVKGYVRSGLESIDPLFGKLGEFTGERYFFVTGIPRSGTSLMCSVLASAENCFCLNEMHPAYRVYASLWYIRRKLQLGLGVRNKYGEGDRPVSDTNRGSMEVGRREVDIDVPANELVIGSKNNVPYLNHLEKLLESGWPIFALVRDPFFTLSSWNSPAVSEIPEARLEPADRSTRYAAVDFRSDELFEMQAQLWNHYATRLWDRRDRLHLVRYEDLTERTAGVVRRAGERLDLEIEELPELENRNDPARYDSEKAESIREAVEEFCPVREKFDYDR